MGNTIYYRSGYKYQLVKGVQVETGMAWGIDAVVETPFLTLHPDGRLEIRSGYAWDGPSGPTIDTLDFMRASLAHDALYQLMRQGYIEPRYRKQADRLMRAICLADGMWQIRGWWVYVGVRYGGHSSADTRNVKEVHVAPAPKYRRNDSNSSEETTQ